MRDGARTVHARAGEAQWRTGRPVPRGARFRVGSVTKAFVATVVLQLVAEGRLSLDDTVEGLLPGVVRGNGNDGRLITVRNLLQHTSGLHDYGPEEDTGSTAADFERTRFDHWEPEQLVAGALRHRPDFPPAPADDREPDWNYSSTGYVLAGMIIEKVTGRTWAEEVGDRVVRPLGLTGTYALGDDPYLKPPYARTYHLFPGSDSWTDITARNPSQVDAAAALVSTERDVDRFFAALLGGRLLPPAQLSQMRQPLTRGGGTWGHGGDLEGFTVRTALTADGRRSVVVAASGTGGGAAARRRAGRPRARGPRAVRPHGMTPP
ncbi:beta-lactamase family protein [Streptomyces sp. JB150]|uniref:serine hydrolase domain-containing protein n=1 Tax=Streptomyces sp. JB150 TaxID=2714844 RepID=UPI001F0F51AB|nr:beta-lactamase family protein [Streptomyces sp. JB150]